MFARFLIATATFVSALAMAQDEPDPAQIYIEEFSYSGSGCPAGTVASNLSPDKEAATFIFSNYVISSAEVAGNLAQKACRLRLKMHVPAGWQFALFGVDYRGFARLDQGVQGFQGTRYDFGAAGATRLPTMRLNGPTNDDYLQIAEVPIERMAFSACNAQSHMLTLDSGVRIEGAQPFRNGAAPEQGLMTIDSLDGQVEEHYGFVWKPCQGPAFQAKCPVLAQATNGRRHVFWGVAFGRSQDAANTKSLNKAIQRCERARLKKPRMQIVCTPRPERCSG